MTQLTVRQSRWIRTTLANDETGTDAEMVEYFVENGITKARAEYFVTLRTDAMNGKEVDLDGQV
ncbi:MAG: hypothetical protein NVS1B6_00130 [Steroidobacteraceae bacterium]